jgi:hypothetical protein
MSELDRAFAVAGPIVGIAAGDDGAVTVEVEVGGKLRAVRLHRRALRYGASYLAQTVVTVAAKATARANHRAAQVYTQVLGPRAGAYLEALGLSYDPALLTDEESPQERYRQARRQPPGTRGRPQEYEDDPSDYPETWLTR